MADSYAGILAWNWRNAGLDLPHHLRVLRLLLRERTSDTGLILRIKLDRIYRIVQDLHVNPETILSMV